MPRELDGTEAIYAAADGTLKHLDPEGNVTDLAPGEAGSLPDGGTTGQVLTKESDTDGDADWEDPQGGSQPGAIASKAFLFTEEATTGGQHFAITGVDQGLGTFTIAGDHTALFDPCDWFLVTDSTGNDGIYAVVSAVLDSGSTVITTDDAIPDATADGDLNTPGYSASFALPAGTQLFQLEYDFLSTWACDLAYLQAADTTPQALISPTPIQSETGHLVAGLADAFGPYDVDVDVDMSVVTSIASPPVVATGVTRVTWRYFTPVTATDATFA